MSIAGHLAAVSDDRFGSELTADLAIGDTVLHVASTVFFDEEQGGQVLIGGVKLTYEAFDSDDDDPDTDGPTELTLTAPSVVAADSGDPVWAFDPTTGEDSPVTETIALVTIDDRDDGNAVPARVRAGLVEQLDSDLETYIGKAVELDVIDGELVLVDILGSKRTGGDKFKQDEFTVAELGDQVCTLTYIPKTNSEHLYWHPDGLAGIYQKASTWTRDQWDVTVPDSAGRLKIGDVLVMEYAYTDPATKPVVEPTGHWVEETYNFKLPGGAGNLQNGAAVVGADTAQEALSDGDSSTYLLMPELDVFPPYAGLWIVPRDLTDQTWEKCRLELDIVVESGDTAKMTWELYIRDPVSGNQAQWNAPATLSTGTMSSKIPLKPEYPEPFMGDNGNLAHYSIENTVYQASRADTEPTDVYVNLDLTIGDGGQGNIRVTGARLIVSRWVLDA